MVAIDSVVRLLPGVLGNETSAVTDSFSTGLLEYPHYTRPAEFRGWKVPDILLSGHHANIDVWRREQALKRTWERRPELLDKLELSKQDRAYIDKLQRSGILISFCSIEEQICEHRSVLFIPLTNRFHACTRTKFV